MNTVVTIGEEYGKLSQTGAALLYHEGMLFEWSAECGPADPVLVVPWSDPASTVRFVDLRADPYALEEIAEAEQHPPIAQALRALNAPRSPLFTAKCDVWPITQSEELRTLSLELMLDSVPGDHLHGQGSYLDLVWRDRSIFASFHQHQHMLHRLERRITALEEPQAAAACVIRPAVLDFETVQEGFAVSLYIRALAHTAAEAESLWSRALAAVVAVLRNRDLMPHTAASASNDT